MIHEKKRLQMRVTRSRCLELFITIVARTSLSPYSPQSVAGEERKREVEQYSNGSYLTQVV